MKIINVGIGVGKYKSFISGGKCIFVQPFGKQYGYLAKH